MLVVLQLSGAIGVSLFDRDEGWYACITREMMATGDYVVPRYLGESAYFKPAWMYWCAAAAVHLFGASELALRLPGIMASILAWWLVADWTACRWGRRGGLWAALIAGTMTLPHVAGTLFLADGHLLLFTVVAMRCWMDDTLASWAWRPYLFWLALGLAVLTKGPAIGVIMLPIWLARWKWDVHKLPWRGWYLGLVVAAPWYVLVMQRDAAAFLAGFVGKNALDVATKATFGHSGPPGYHLALLPLTAWPWAALLPLCLWRAWNTRRDDVTVKRLLIWAAAPWPLFELLGTKLPHYVLPLFPPLVMLIAKELASGGAAISHPKLLRFTRAAWRLGLLAGCIALAVAGVFLLSRAGMAGHGAGIGLCLTAVVLAAGAMAGWRAVELNTVCRIGAVYLLVMMVLLGFGVLPRLEPFRLSRIVAQRATGAAAYASTIAVHGFDEPSLFYYLPRGALTMRRLRESRDVPADERAVLIVRQKRLIDIRQDWRLDESTAATLEGFNYVTGRWEVVWVGWGAARSDLLRLPADPG